MGIDTRDLIGLVVADIATSLAFYRRPGLDIPPDADAVALLAGCGAMPSGAESSPSRTSRRPCGSP
ncbi:MAG: hypothetical protein ACRDZO_07995 [Egibacteraceae bacterium]